MARELGIFEIMYNCRATRRLKQDPVPAIRGMDAPAKPVFCEVTRNKNKGFGSEGEFASPERGKKFAGRRISGRELVSSPVSTVSQAMP